MSSISVFWHYVTHKILEVSSLSDFDYVCICAHYTYLSSGQREEIDPALESRGYTEEQLRAARKHSQSTFKPVVIQNLKFSRNLGNFKYGLMSYILTLFQNFERGILPYPGSLSEQPAQIIEIFNLLASLRSEQEQKATINNVRDQYQNYGRPRRQSSAKGAR